VRSSTYYRYSSIHASSLSFRRYVEQKRTIVRHPRKLVFVYKDAYKYRRARYVDII